MNDLTPVVSRRTALQLAGLGAIALGLTPVLAACGGGDKSSGGGKLTSLTVGNWQNPVSLDPNAATENSMNWVSYAMFDPLVWAVPSANGPQYVAGLATAWKASDDLTSWTFTLRDGVTFHDGTPFDANAVKATMDRIVAPNFSGTKAKALLANYKGIVVVDPHTVRIELTKPSASFINAVCAPQLGIVSPTALQKLGSGFGDQPVGTGFMKFESLQKGQSVTLSRNPNYTWGPQGVWNDKATLDKLTFSFLPDQQARGNALRSHAVDFTNKLLPQDMATLIKDSTYQHYDAVSRGVNYSLIFNTSRAPFDDVHVRQAIQYAVDRDQLVKTLGGGIFKPAQSVVSSATDGFDAATQNPFPYDLAKAKSMLDAAGWTMQGSTRAKDGQPMKLELISLTGFGMEQAGPYIQALLKDDLGIEVSVSAMQYPAVGQVLNAGKFDISNYSYFGLDANVIYQTTWATAQIASGFNYSHFSDKALDAKVQSIESVADPDERARMFKEVFAAIAQASPHLPMWELTGDWFSGRGAINGIAFSPLDGSPLFHGVTG